MCYFLTKRIFRPIELGHDTENELDYNFSGKDSFGTLACRSRNEIGEQKMPCLFQLLPKGLYKEKLFFPFQVYITVSRVLHFCKIYIKRI